MKLIIINGPNLNLLGKREPEVYGNESFESYFEKLKKRFPDVELSYFQSNIEGEIVDKIQEVGFSYDGIIINAGGAYQQCVCTRGVPPHPAARPRVPRLCYRIRTQRLCNGGGKLFVS